MNAVASRVPLRALTSGRSGHRAKWEYCGATDAHNAKRVMRLISHHGPNVTWAQVRKFVESLPQIVAAEAQTAFALGADIDPCGRASQLDYAEAMERGCVLESWARDCEFLSTRDACMELVRRAVKRAPR
jgi:hypothetical protein